MTDSETRRIQIPAQKQQFMVVLLILGSIFTLGGLAIYLIGRQRGVNNALLWGLFPVLHGFHEFAEYLLEELNAPFIVERFEILFAIGSSIILVVAIMEYLGSIPRPYGKLSGTFAIIIISYFLFGLSEEIIEEIEHQTFSVGPLNTNFFRFFYGAVLVLLAIVILIITYIQVHQSSTRLDVGRLRQITGVSVILLIIFAIFEGFSSENPIFITLRGISAVLFLIVPAYVLFSTEVGLQHLLITHQNGTYIVGYDFSNQQVLDEDSYILTGNFIAAISSFTEEDSRIGGLSEITTTQGSYIINHQNEYLISMLTRNINSDVRTAMLSFTKQVPEFISTTDGIKYNEEEFVDKLNQEFANYF